MSTPAQIVEQGIQNGYEHARDRQEEIEDEKRKGQLKTLLEDATTPQDRMAAYDAVYHKDPGVLKQHVENLTRRLTGKAPQSVVNPQQAQASRVADLTARAQTPEQQTLTNTQRTLDWLNKLPPDERRAAEQILGVRMTSRLQNFRNAKTGETVTWDTANGETPGPDWVLAGNTVPKTTADEAKRSDYEALAASGQLPKDAHGNPLSYESWVAYAAAQGRTSGEPVKPGTPRVGVSHGKNVYGLLTPNGWVDAGTGQPLDDFRPAPTYAQIAPSLRTVQVVDPNDPTSTVYESIPEALKTHAQGTQSIGYKMQMPTAQERGRADLAISAREQLGTMETILQNRSDLFGPSSGRYTNFTEWVGSQDPDAQRFAAAARIAADHLAGGGGGRSQAALQAIYDIIGKNTTNPAAAIAGLEQMNIAAARIQSRGMGPAPKKAQPKSGGADSDLLQRLKAATGAQ